MKGLFPYSQLGANYLNAKKSERARNSTPTTCQHAFPVLCSRCGEPGDNGKPSLKIRLATGASLMCFVIMLGACVLVQELGRSLPFEAYQARKSTTYALKITIAVFTACIISHLTIARRAFGMSLRRMLFWAASLGCGTGLSTIVLLKTTIPSWERHWGLVVQFVMWAVLVALIAVYYVEALRLEHETPETKGETIEITDEKLRT